MIKINYFAFPGVGLNKITLTKELLLKEISIELNIPEENIKNSKIRGENHIFTTARMFLIYFCKKYLKKISATEISKLLNCTPSSISNNHKTFLQYLNIYQDLIDLKNKMEIIISIRYFIEK